VRTDDLSVPAKGRVDVDAHSLGSYQTGLIVWEPDDPNAEIRLRQARYYFDGTASFDTLIAVNAVPAARSTGSRLAAAFDTRNKTAVLEISNTRSVSVDVDVSLYNADGSATTSAVPAITLAPMATVHVVLNSYLSSGLGNAVVDGDTAQSLIASLINYGRAADGSLVFADNAPLRDGAGTAYRGSYNSYLGQSCRLLVGNTMSSDQDGTLSMTRYDGTVLINTSSVTVPGNGALEVDICSNETDPAYGEVLMAPDSAGAFIADGLRENSEGTVEFTVGLRE
jgi:hypothetical protein